MSEIVIIGGGPVGCWTALQTLKHNPGVNIQVYEKHAEYQRHHMLGINRNTLKAGLGKSESDQNLLNEILSCDQNLRNSENSAKIPSVIHVQIQDLERVLKKHCEKAGVKFTYANIESPEDAMKLHPECDLFVAADGARSTMRKALLGPNDIEEKDLLYSVDVKYQAIGQAEYTRTPTYNKIDMIVVETIGKEENGSSQVALRYLLDKNTYDSIPDCNFKEPIRDHAKTGQQFSPEIEKFWKIRKDHTGENRIKGSEEISKVRLSQYASSKFSVMAPREENSPHRAGWFFVGDSAMGMPFYRSINAGMKLGAKLGPILADPETSASIKSKLYQDKRYATVHDEFAAVTRKLAGINFYRNVYRRGLRLSRPRFNKAANPITSKNDVVIAPPSQQSAVQEQFSRSSKKQTALGTINKYTKPVLIGTAAVVTAPVWVPLLAVGAIGVKLGVIRLM